MKELIEQIKIKADSIPTNTKENRRVKGAYIDCLMMVKEASKNLVQPAVMPSCDGNCGMNYCDDNGCIERKRVLVEPKDLPEHVA